MPTGADWAVGLGYASIASWLIPGAAQLVENYKLQSGDGLSVAFVLIWLAGDLLNGVGALRQGLLSTIVYLAFWYVLTDLTLLFQIFLYSNRQNGPSIIQEEESLLAADEAGQLVYGSVSAHSQEVSQELAHAAHAAARADAEEQAASEDQMRSRTQLIAGHALGLVFIATVGVLGRYLQGPAQYPDPDRPHEIKWDAQALGWTSAALYLSSRVPQIVRNRTTKCEGLSLSLFSYALLGNGTYVASILVLSTDRRYILESLSWLVGSGAVMLMDLVVLYQFLIYAPDRRRMHLDRLVEEAKRRNQSAVEV